MDVDKICKECGLTKSIDLFYSGRNCCKECYNKKQCVKKKAEYPTKRDSILVVKKAYYLKNSEEILSDKKQYGLLNKDKISTKNRKYYLANKDNELYKAKRRNEQKMRNRVRREHDIDFKISQNLRSRLWHAIKNDQKGGSAINDLGCSIEYLKRHLESQFESWMTWDNYGRKDGIRCWEIDHIEALSKFDLSNPEQVKIACCYTNLKPMCAKDNIRKSNK